MNNPIRMLSAIMFSDIVGYTSLMQEDDDLPVVNFSITLLGYGKALQTTGIKQDIRNR